MRTTIAEKLINNEKFKEFFKQKTGVKLTTSKTVLPPDGVDRHSNENEDPNTNHNMIYGDSLVWIGYKDNRTTFYNKNKEKKGVIIYTEESEEKTLQLSCSIIEDDIISEKTQKCNTISLDRNNDKINSVINDFNKEKSNSDDTDGR